MATGHGHSCMSGAAELACGNARLAMNLLW